MKFKNKKIKLNMTKENITMSLSILVVTVLFISILLVQFKTVEEVNETDIENMRETELREQLSSWKIKYEETSQKLDDVNSKIDEYNQKIESNEESSELLDKELLQSKILLGTTDVSGEGIVITLEDTDESSVNAYDLLELVNELREAGAEAISINDVRIIATTDIVDIMEKYILIKPKQRISSPYTIKAIGNQTYLVSTLSLKNTGYIDIHKHSGQSIKVEKQKNVTIQKYTGNLEIQYMKEDEE